MMTLHGGPACPLSWAGWAHDPTQAKKPIPLQAGSKGGIGRASMCSRPAISTPLLMNGNLNPASAHRAKGRKMQTPTCLLPSQRFSWTDSPGPCVSSPQQARGCAGDLCVAMVFLKIKSYCLLGSSWASLVSQMVKNLPAMGDPDSIPRSGRSPWRREWPPTPVFLPR